MILSSPTETVTGSRISSRESVEPGLIGLIQERDRSNSRRSKVCQTERAGAHH